jgi:outer membrane murein-binding lipoprotein Lpp
MENKGKDKRVLIAAILFVSILFVSAIAETIFYYSGKINDSNPKIANLNNEIANLNSQISNLESQLRNLTGQLTNLTSAYLVTALGVTDVPYSYPQMPINQPYNHLYISGSVTNTGKGTAYNAGLNVVAYDNGTLEINMTVPLGDGVFGSDTKTNGYVTSNFGNSSLQLGILYSRQTATIDLAIYHEGTVTNWTVTPVWTNLL